MGRTAPRGDVAKSCSTTRLSPDSLSLAPQWQNLANLLKPVPPTGIDAVYERAEQYRDYADIARRTHYKMSDARARTHQWIGALAIIAAAVVSTGFLASINSHQSNAFKLVGGIIALVAATLSGFQTFYKFSDVGEKHRVAAANYGEVRRDLELYLAKYSQKNPADLISALQELDELSDHIDGLDRAGPGYPGRVYRRVKKESA
jgi:conflict system pore-forming effector with SLATT domain